MVPGSMCFDVMNFFITYMWSFIINQSLVTIGGPSETLAISWKIWTLNALSAKFGLESMLFDVINLFLLLGSCFGDFALFGALCHKHPILNLWTVDCFRRPRTNFGVNANRGANCSTQVSLIRDS